MSTAAFKYKQTALERKSCCIKTCLMFDQMVGWKSRGKGNSSCWKMHNKRVRQSPNGHCCYQRVEKLHHREMRPQREPTNCAHLARGEYRELCTAGATTNTSMLIFQVSGNVKMLAWLLAQAKMSVAKQRAC